jgi:hypothetical protein
VAIAVLRLVLVVILTHRAGGCNQARGRAPTARIATQRQAPQPDLYNGRRQAMVAP